MRALLVLCLLLVPLAYAQGSEGEGPHLLVRVTQVKGSADVFVNVSEFPGETPYESAYVQLDEGDVFELPVERVGAMYAIVEARMAGTTPFDERRGFSWYGVDSTGCQGAYLAEFSVSDASPNSGDSGCLERPTEFDALVAEARAALAERARGQVAVPMPSDGDRGVLLHHAMLVPPPADEWGAIPFETRGTNVRDAWGREVEGIDVTYDPPGGGGAGAQAPLQGFVAESTLDIMEHIRWAGRDVDVSSWTIALPSSGIGDQLVAQARIDQYTLYREPIDPLHCVFRHAAQGTRVEAGAPAEGCPFLASTWRAGSATEWHGFRAVALYAVDDWSVHRMVLADGVPYVVELESWLQDPESGIVEHSFTTLDRLASGSAPLDPPAAPAPPTPTLSPIDPLAGPKLDAARARFAYPLDQAVADARADPTLQNARPLLARSDAVLAGAVLDLQQQDEGGPRTQRWWLVFSARDAKPVGVLCERAGLAAGPLSPLAPVARCTEPSRAPTFAEDLGTVPSLSRGEAVSVGASFDDAVARSDAAQPERAGRAITFVTYRAWANDGPASLAVGEAIPTSFAPSPTAGGAEGGHVLLDLANARTLRDVSSYRSVPGLSPVPEGIAGASRAPSSPPLSGTGIPLLVGAGVAALGILALLVWGAFAMYSRLTRSDVVEGPVRAQILDIVRAEPGIHASGILDKADKAHGVGEYHLGVLVREGFLTTIESPGFKRYFLTGRFSTTEMRMLAALKDGQAEKLFRIIEANPGISLSDVAERAGVSLPYASRTVKRLAEAGLVDRVQVGRAVSLHAIER